MPHSPTLGRLALPLGRFTVLPDSMRKNTSPAEGAGGLVHQCRLPLSSATLDLQGFGVVA